MKTERAYAKINLFLTVTSKRENGYHNIQSIMQTVSLCDVLTLDWQPDAETAVVLTATGNPSMPTDRSNLAVRAAERYLNATGLCGRLHITLEKHIPMAAGLAGGSADAAAVLRGLNTLCGSVLSVEQLCALGATMGADIPFCIVGGGARVFGIGEELERIPPMPDCAMVVACMGEGVSTPWAYGKLDERYANFAEARTNTDRIDRLSTALREDGIAAAIPDFYNMFEEVVPSVQPYVEQLKAKLYEHGARVAMMSGSGPSVFGVFSTDAQAEAACQALRELGAASYVCRPIGALL